jgi:hypothetical protein
MTTHDLTVGELIALLNEFDPELPVRVAHQPGYPMQLMLDVLIALRHSPDSTDYNEKTVFLLATNQPDSAPYAPVGIFDGRLHDDDNDDDDIEWLDTCAECGRPVEIGPYTGDTRHCREHWGIADGVQAQST